MIGPRSRLRIPHNKLTWRRNRPYSVGYRGCEYRLRWGAVWGHDACDGFAEWVVGKHAVAATGAFGGAPYGATQRVMGLPTGWWGGLQTKPLGPTGEHMGPRSR